MKITFRVVLIVFVLLFPVISFSADGSVKWRYYANGTMPMMPTVPDFGSNAYFASNDYLIAVNYGSGNLVWKQQIPSTSSFPIAVSKKDSHLYYAYENVLACYDFNGNYKWQSESMYAVKVPPAVDSTGTVYVGTELGVNIIKNDGTLLIENGIHHRVRTSLALGENSYYVTGLDDHNDLYLVSAPKESGDFRWRYLLGKVTAVPLAITRDEVILVGDSAGKLRAINANGALVWEYDAPSAIVTSPITDEKNHVYFVTAEGKLYALDASGALVSVVSLGIPGGSHLARGNDGNFYIVLANGTVKATDKDGTQLWSYGTGKAVVTTPVIVNSQLLVSVPDGFLYSFETHTTQNAVGAWPMYRQSRQGTSEFMNFENAFINAMGTDFGVSFDGLFTDKDDNIIAKGNYNWGWGSCSNQYILLNKSLDNLVNVNTGQCYSPWRTSNEYILANTGLHGPMKVLDKNTGVQLASDIPGEAATIAVSGTYIATLGSQFTLYKDNVVQWSTNIENMTSVRSITIGSDGVIRLLGIYKNADNKYVDSLNSYDIRTGIPTFKLSSDTYYQSGGSERQFALGRDGKFYMFAGTEGIYIRNADFSLKTFIPGYMIYVRIDGDGYIYTMKSNGYGNPLDIQKYTDTGDLLTSYSVEYATWLDFIIGKEYVYLQADGQVHILRKSDLSLYKILHFENGLTLKTLTSDGKLVTSFGTSLLNTSGTAINYPGVALLKITDETGLDLAGWPKDFYDSYASNSRWYGDTPSNPYIPFTLLLN
ncbi:MAG: PQQ-binding-like beta-propeller repeat protein [Solidesulfovibrio sp.]|uniref:outer membrane protein assembly factor BamB family protein n=1 Tax=Solidesulfovibrio sp. TaxID=2910990 RepID=UPI002B2015EA|nr:PQQ-binding-like beta-propeller repeat protein [Solidesulfovibrio sp.]MEA4858152.1 PQQ-binding-like beta-propeller repeat protein [Solidesulfovibrio sp.]